MIKINVANTQYEVVSDLANELDYLTVTDLNDKDSDLFWIDNALAPDQLSQLTSFQRINHFPGMFVISRKDYLGKLLKSMRTLFPESYCFFPPTWVLPRDYPDLKQQFNEKRAKTFICKPENLSQGKGIFLTRRIDEIPERCVVQRYLHRPFLLEGLKFDLRVYVLITSCDPLRVYMHKEGLVRLATEPYISPLPSNLDSICMHLTNYAINKNSSKFEFNSNPDDNFSGHKRSLSVLFDKLTELGHDSKQLCREIGNIVVKTLCVAQPSLSHLYRSSQPNDLTGSICFQILGFDIILTDKLKPILLEVNHTPSFTVDTPLDLYIKKAVIGDALKMVGLERRADIEVKVTRGRGMKEVRTMRNEVKEKWANFKSEIEEKNKGGYTKIYPNSEDDYLDYIYAARDLWLTNMGVKKKKSRESSLVAIKPQVNPSPVKHFNSFTPVQKSYGQSPIPTSGRRTCDRSQKRKNQNMSKLPAIKLAFGNYLHPRLFDFNDNTQSIVANKEEKQG